MDRKIKITRNLCVALAVAMLVGIGSIIFTTAPRHANANNMAATLIGEASVGVPAPVPPPLGYTTVGNGSISFAATTSTLCLSGTANASIPCSRVWLQTSGSAANSLVGTSSASTSYILGNVTPSTTASAAQYPYLDIPCSNVNQIFVTSTGTASTANYFYFKP